LAGTIGTEEQPLRVAIIGAGPAGFYAADQILRDEETHAQVDLFDRLPTPYGLVRGGVAPDHPKIKAVTRVYERTAGREGFRFFGNVEVGRDVTIADLEGLYHAIIYTFGAESDRELGIPGEELTGSHPAIELVGWYNAHPDYADLDFGLERVRRAVVIGNGNVALDICRMLALDEAELRRTDIADHAIEVLAGSAIEEIVVIGRRGPAQAAFTNPEIIELGELEEADITADPAEVELDPVSRAWIESDDADKTARVNVETVTDYAGRDTAGKPKRITLRFLASPKEIRGSSKVEEIVIGRNELVEEDGFLRARDTGESEVLACELVVRAVGYTGVPVDGVPFDRDRGTIPNDRGRVLESPEGELREGHYTAGWIKRGPSGVIGTNKKCANETVELLLEDVQAGRLLEPDRPEPDAVGELLASRGVDFVTYTGWEKIDRTEVGRGEPHGRPRIKFASVEELLGAAGNGPE
jgi:ferredoxin--NADP+ reductase